MKAGPLPRPNGPQVGIKNHRGHLTEEEVQETKQGLGSFLDERVHPWKINGWNLKIHPWKRKIIFQSIIFRFYVNLPGCIRFENRGEAKHTFKKRNDIEFRECLCS